MIPSNPVSPVEGVVPVAPPVRSELVGPLVRAARTIETMTTIEASSATTYAAAPITRVGTGVPSPRLRSVVPADAAAGAGAPGAEAVDGPGSAAAHGAAPGAADGATPGAADGPALAEPDGAEPQAGAADGAGEVGGAK